MKTIDIELLKLIIGVFLVRQIKGVLSILFTAALVLQVIAGNAAAATFYVDDGSGNHTTIQAALNDAIEGDTIIVNPGTYNEDITINTSNLVIMSRSGNPADTIIQGDGFRLTHDAQGVTIKGFTLKGNGISYGITIEQFADCIIEKNKILDYDIGVDAHLYSTFSINKNEISNCKSGVYVGECFYGATVSNNIISNCETGIFVGDLGHPQIENNIITENDYGITLMYEGGATVAGNTIIFNRKCGLQDNGYGGSIVHNNNFNNTVNVILGGYHNSPNRWNTTRTTGKNIIGGPSIGGNFWGSPSGNGFSQTHLDINGDGIAEEPYYINQKNIDYLPLVTPRTEPEPVFPVANFTTNATKGNAPLAVQFKDTSQFATGRNWNFGDGRDSIEQNPVHIYSVAGTYTVNLTAINTNGTASKTTTIKVSEQPKPVFPITNFTANITDGYAPLTVQFTDTSQYATGRNWDFEDDGVTDSTIQNPVHVYTIPGDYIVRLTAVNTNGTDSKSSGITVYAQAQPVPPIADFTANVTSGYAPLSVLFTDLSQNATSRSWDINNDGIEDSNEASFVYIYTSSGTYTAKLTATNSNGTATKTTSIAVEEKGSNVSSGGSSGGSSSGSSGGGGGSPEPAKNVRVKELAQVFITNGQAVKFEFIKNATCVMYVGFDAIRNAGKTTTIVEELKGKSVLVSELPEDEIYRSFNVWVGNAGYATSKNIDNPAISFRVEKAWVHEKNIDQASIILNRYEEKVWVQLPVTLTGEDSRYMYFTAATPGFASFAITGKSLLQAQEESIQIPAENRSVDVIHLESNGAERAKPDKNSKNRNTMLSFGIVLVALAVVGLVLRSMKK